MTHCRPCWHLHGRAARWSLRHWWRCHVRKRGVALWLVVLLIYVVVWVVKR